MVKIAVLGDVTNKKATNQGAVAKKKTTKPIVKHFHLMSKSEKLLANCRYKCKKITEEYGEGYDWVLDDTSTFSYRSNLAGYMFKTYMCFRDEPAHLAPDWAYVREEDQVDRFRVWVAFSSAGLAKVHIMDFEDKYDQNVYLEKCVKDTLIPFIEANHNPQKTILWSNASVAHQGKQVISYLDSKSINYISKDQNPGVRVRCPLYFWSKLKIAVYKRGWIAKDKEDLRQRIEKCISEIGLEKVAEIAADAYTRINEMAEFGEIRTNNKVKNYYTFHDYSDLDSEFDSEFMKQCLSSLKALQ